MSKNEHTSSDSNSRSWKNYNESQTHEKERFLTLLYELCLGVEEPGQEDGRRRLLLKDMVFCMCFKVYSLLSARRFMSDLRHAHRAGLISHVPHFNSVLNYMGVEFLTPILQRLIEESSRILNSVETIFAVDSTGMRTRERRNWYNRRKDRVQLRRVWRKLHCICGVQTNIITWAEVSDGHANDSPFFKELVERTARHFDISEVSADAGYIAAHNQRQVLLLGAIPYIAYRSNSSPYSRPKSTFYKRMLELYRERKPEFLDHYYRRNNIESTFSMMKAKFGDRLRGKSECAQENEALCKVICHNLCVLIQSFTELNFKIAFYTEARPKESATPPQGALRRAMVLERIPALAVKAASRQEASERGAKAAEPAEQKCIQSLPPLLERMKQEVPAPLPEKPTEDSASQNNLPSRRCVKRMSENRQFLFHWPDSEKGGPG